MIDAYPYSGRPERVSFGAFPPVNHRYICDVCHLPGVGAKNAKRHPSPSKCEETGRKRIAAAWRASKKTEAA
jgi:hypothetical protein